MKTTIKIFCIALVLLFFAIQLSFAADVSLAWDAESISTLAGYRVYYGTASGIYGTPIDVGDITSYTVSGLQAGTYYFAVTAYDNTGVESAYSNEATGSIGGAPAISSVIATIIQSTSATISWTTDIPSTSQMVYGTTTSYGSTTPLGTSLLTSHSQNLTGLAPGTTYQYSVKSSANGILATSPNQSFTTIASTPIPSSLVISSVAYSSVTSTTARISWTTNLPSNSLVQYGTSTSYRSKSYMTTGTNQSVVLMGLFPNTSYHFRVAATANGGTIYSRDYTFKTLARHH